MAKKNKERIILEDIELKPQVIGYIYKKKSNIGRVIFIFIVFALVVFYINDISVFINDLIGKKSAQSIEDLSGSNNNLINNGEELEQNEIVYNIYVNGLEIKESNIKLNNFYLNNNKLTFDVVNTTNNELNLSDKKYFIEIYSEEKTLLERHKLDIKNIANNSKLSFEYTLNNSFYYIVLEEKSINDYPVVNLIYDNNGLATITCTKDINNIVYTFLSDELIKIEHTIKDNNTTDSDYYIKYNSYQNKATKYNNMDGITATFSSTLSEYTAIFAIDLQKANLSLINEKYYYAYKELPKVVKFEMQTYGFNCK